VVCSCGAEGGAEGGQSGRRGRGRGGEEDEDEEEKAEERELGTGKQKGATKAQEIEDASSLSLSQTYYHLVLILGAIAFAGAGFFDGSAINCLANSLPSPKFLLVGATGVRADLDCVHGMTSGGEWGSALKHARASRGSEDRAEVYNETEEVQEEPEEVQEEPMEVQEEPVEVQEPAEVLADFYRKHNHHKVHTAEKTVQQYAGRLLQLDVLLKAKYGEAPSWGLQKDKNGGSTASSDNAVLAAAAGDHSNLDNNAATADDASQHTDADGVQFEKVERHPHEASRQARIKLLQQAGVQTDMPAKRKAIASSMVANMKHGASQTGRTSDEKIPTKTSGSTFTDEDGIQFEVVTRHPHFIRRQARIKQLHDHYQKQAAALSGYV
jgi:hypothetical protein